MALKKKIPQASGVEPDYFMLDRVIVIPANKRIDCSFSGYLNAAARDADKKPVEGADVVVSFLGDDYDDLTADNEWPTKSAVYAKVKGADCPLKGATNN